MSVHKKVMCLAAGLLISIPAIADTIAVTPGNSFDFQGDTDNYTFVMDIGAGSEVTGIDWDLTLTPVAPSWAEESIIGFGSTTAQGFALQLFPGDTDSSVESSAGSMGLAPTFFVNADGLLVVEFYEINFDDITDGVDAYWDGELNVTFTRVPEPGTLALLGLGLAGLGLARRRKANA